MEFEWFGISGFFFFKLRCSKFCTSVRFGLSMEKAGVHSSPTHSCDCWGYGFLVAAPEMSKNVDRCLVLGSYLGFSDCWASGFSLFFF